MLSCKWKRFCTFAVFFEIMVKTAKHWSVVILATDNLQQYNHIKIPTLEWQGIVTKTRSISHRTGGVILRKVESVKCGYWQWSDPGRVDPLRKGSTVKNGG